MNLNEYGWIKYMARNIKSYKDIYIEGMMIWRERWKQWHWLMVKLNNKDTIGFKIERQKKWKTQGTKCVTQMIVEKNNITEVYLFPIEYQHHSYHMKLFAIPPINTAIKALDKKYLDAIVFQKFR